MLNLQQETPAAPTYDDDFILWVAAQAEFIRAGQYELLDRENLLDELAYMVRREHHEIRSRLENIVLHLLKCKYQPERKTHSWIGSIHEHRRQIAHLLEASPSLRRTLLSYVDRGYGHVARQAGRETGMAVANFPAACPFSVEQILDEDFFP
jgi:hypothetical protein